MTDTLQTALILLACFSPFLLLGAWLWLTRPPVGFLGWLTQPLRRLADWFWGAGS